MLPVYLQLLATSLASFLAASSGFWIYLRHRSQAKDATTRLLMGLAHDKITYFGLKYIERGYVTKDEYEDLVNYFYKPYVELGGNGTAERIMHVVQRLPFYSKSQLVMLTDATEIRSTDRTANPDQEDPYNDDN